MPINDGVPNLYRQGLFPTLTYTEDANGDGRLDALGSDGNDLLSLLASCRQLIVNNGLGANNNTFLFGWLAGNPIDGNGLARVPGFNAFGNTEVVRGQRGYAHELTHNFRVNHNNESDQVGWDVGARLNNNWAGNNATGRVKPMTLFDIRSAGLLTNQAWVDTITYNYILASPTLAHNDSIMARAEGVSSCLPFKKRQASVWQLFKGYLIRLARNSFDSSLSFASLGNRNQVLSKLDLLLLKLQITLAW